MVILGPVTDKRNSNLGNSHNAAIKCNEGLVFASVPPGC
jgi:hypothetical protein